MIFHQGCANDLTNSELMFPDDRDDFAFINEGFPCVFFSLNWDVRVQRSRDDFEAQFPTSFKNSFPNDDHGYEEWLDGMIADDDAGGFAYAKFCHKFVIPPKIALPGVKYIPLDPRCPQLCDGPDMGYDFAIEWGDFTPEEIRRLEKLDEKDISGFIPKYRLPWYGGEALTWDSHWGALFVHMIKNWALTSAMLGI
ncbi:hypothetical protein [Novosphingobium sp. RL4]|jgi:hypothetical protein|uniref:hypothetical protein n=1 Tax=Novosphingobium sp. RL4 TaxID=3109595 RepID=UPI002D77E008|nr:hypothetical protein [Novosphingobium sp. RL4]WRT94052.1 hypothetical protein U9J33_05960 [Novosphingobium sp. RL4]